MTASTKPEWRDSILWFSDSNQSTRDQHLTFQELASKPVQYVACNQIGRIMLDKVTGLVNGEQGPVVLQPLPCIVQGAWQQKLVLQAVNLEYRLDKDIRANPSFEYTSNISANSTEDPAYGSNEISTTSTIKMIKTSLRSSV